MLPVVVAWLVVCAACRAEAPDRPAERHAAGGRKVLIVGLDGADWLVLEPLMAAGKLPVFSRLKAGGRAGTLLATPPLLSPILWTTIATGRQPEDHGVLDFMVDLPSGGQAPVAVTSRRVQALWNIFSNAGRRVGVVGWWATWPAETVRGTVVSDRVAPQLTRPDVQLDPQAIAPPSEARRLSSALVRARDISYEELARYVPLTRREHDAALAAPAASPGRFYENRIGHLAAVIAGTRTYSAMAAAIAESGQPDLLAVYLEGIDTTSHLFIRDPVRGPKAIEAAYRDADALITRLAAACAPDTWIVVCSDHGFQPPDAAVAEDPADLAGPASAWHRPYGIVGAAEARTLMSDGVASSPPADLGTITPLDLAPTVLHMAGLPVSSEMPGRVITAMLPGEAVARAVTRVPSLERPRSPAPAPATGGVDAEVQARLQALGYVGATPTSLARQNLGEILYRRGALAAAERELRAVVLVQPQNLSAHLWLAKALRDQGRPREALRAYERALALPGGLADGLVEAADLAVSAKLLAEGRRLLGGLRPSAADVAPLRTAQAILAQADGQAATAERFLRAALVADPVSFEALSRLLDLLMAARRPRDVLPFAKAAAARAPRSPRHLALLGEALLAGGEAAGAEQALARALSLAPDGAAVRLDLARSQVAQRAAERAIATLGPLPPSVERAILLGAAYAGLERWTEAAVQYGEALDKGGPNPHVLNGLAWAQLKLGRNDEAAALLDRSLGMQRDQPHISRLLAEIRGTRARTRN